ncbi:hypothetical protein [Nonomuraea longicatena]|uniref:Uncharacterized protein n=1 Tax=Nonomuraea longicatena TaxID=83682 RepID=A0ABN1R1D6_9ACTN
MGALWRAALAGAVIGVAEFLLFLYAPGGDLARATTMVVALPVLGPLACRAAGLPRWPLAGLAGAAVMLGFAVVMLRAVSLSELADLGAWPAGASMAAIGATAFLAGAGLVVPWNAVMRVAVVGVVVVAYAGVWTVRDTIDRAARVQRLADSGVPLLAPSLQAYRLVGVDEQAAPWLALDYRHWSDGSAIAVYVGPASVTAEQACASPLPKWRAAGTARCRQAPGGAWVRQDGRLHTVVAVQGGALVQVESERVGEAELLAMLPTFRPVTAEALLRR